MLLVGVQHESMHTLVVSLPLCFSLFVSCVVAFFFQFNSNSAMTPACQCNLRGIIRQTPCFGLLESYESIAEKKTKPSIQQPIRHLPSSRHLGRQQSKTLTHPPSKKPKSCVNLFVSLLPLTRTTVHANRISGLHSSFRKPICGDRS